LTVGHKPTGWAPRASAADTRPAHDCGLSLAPSCGRGRVGGEYTPVGESGRPRFAARFAGATAGMCTNPATPTRSRGTAHRAGGVSSRSVARPTGRTAGVRPACRRTSCGACGGKMPSNAQIDRQRAEERRTWWRTATAARSRRCRLRLLRSRSHGHESLRGTWHLSRTPRSQKLRSWNDIGGLG